MDVLIDNVKPRRIEFVKWRWKDLYPGSEYTFFRVFTSPSLLDAFTAYKQLPPGKYTARVWVADQPMPNTEATFSMTE